MDEQVALYGTFLSAEEYYVERGVPERRYFLILEEGTVEMHSAARDRRHVDAPVVVHIVQRYFFEVRHSQRPEQKHISGVQVYLRHFVFSLFFY